MAMQDELAHPATNAPAIEPTGSQAWWQSRSSDELQAIIHRGVQGGEIFFPAATEMERRVRDAEAARSAQESREIKVARRKPWLLLLAVLLATLAAAAVLLLLGL